MGLSGPYYVRKSRWYATKPISLASYPPSPTYCQRSMVEEDKGGWLTLPRSGDLWGQPIILPSDMDSSPTLRISFHHALKSVWIGGTRWSHAMDSWAHRVPSAPYKRTPRPPPKNDPFGSRNTRRNKSRALQCSRLVARERGSSWATCPSSGSSLGGSVKPCIFNSTSCKISLSSYHSIYMAMLTFNLYLA